jgi:iron complex transport system ATP-binding protein
MSRLEGRELIRDIPGRTDGSPLNLVLEAGQVWGVLGPNGVGKTTLLHTLAGLRPPRSGVIRLNGEPLARLSRRQVAQQIGLVFQEQQDSFPATVMETALIGRHPYLSPWRMEGAEDLQIARESLRRLGVVHLSDRLVGTLSGGERQRVAIATTLTQSPRIWLADEPTNHLDLHHQVEVMALLAEQAAAGSAVFMCLHDINLAARWCDHLLLLFPGGELCAGPATQMLVPEVLERLYGQRLATAEVEGRAVFVPVR